MDEGNEPPVLPEPPADLEIDNDLVQVPPSTIDSPNIPSQGTNSESIPASGLEDGTSGQHIIDDNDTAADQTTDSATGDLINDKDTAADRTIDTDMVTDSATGDLIDDNDTAADQSTDMVTDSATGDLPNETVSDTITEDADVDLLPDTNDSLNDSNLDDSTPENRKRTRPDQKTEKISQFPLGRVRDIMKADPDIKIVSGDCVFLVAKATEMFLQRLGKEIHTVTLRNKKKTLQKRDLEAAISENAAFEFLEGALN